MDGEHVVYYALGAALVYALLSGVDHSVQTQRRRRRQHAACPGAPTLLIVMYSRLDNYAAAATIRELAQAALCPLRIHVAVVQGVAQASTDVYDLYEEAGGGLPDGAVRVLTVTEDFPSTLAAYDMAVEALYQGETFVLFTTPGTVFAQHFDTALTAQMMSPTTKKVALVNHGPKFLLSKTTQHSKSMRHYYAAAFPAEPPSPDDTLWFPTLQPPTNDGKLPVVVPAAGPLTKKVTVAVQSIAASSVCTMLRAPVPVLNVVGGDASVGDSFLLSAALHAHGYTFSASSTTVCFERSTRRKPVNEDLPRPQAVRAYMDFAGVDPATYTLYGRARLGLVTLRPTEIVAKFGSDVAFQRTKNSLR